ncbi:MAG: 50S ribosomal protein L32 [Deltaproteobacteria bacterium]|nr:MAG: 50S ribosomal protein L32 [Deltaproteobacteria bacterium]
MAVPKKRKSPSRRDMRRAHHDRITAPNVSACPECGEMRLPHHACPSCGSYRGRTVEGAAADVE